MISIKEVAEKAGVSVPTAYKVYDENYNTTEDVKQRVLCAARELNYVHKSKQKKKGAEEGKIVAIVYNEQTNSFNNYITQALSNELERFGHRLVVLHDDETIAANGLKRIKSMEKVLKYGDTISYDNLGELENETWGYSSLKPQEDKAWEFMVQAVKENPDFTNKQIASKVACTVENVKDVRKMFSI